MVEENCLDGEVDIFHGNIYRRLVQLFVEINLGNSEETRKLFTLKVVIEIEMNFCCDVVDELVDLESLDADICDPARLNEPVVVDELAEKDNFVGDNKAVGGQKIAVFRVIADDFVVEIAERVKRIENYQLKLDFVVDFC